MRASTILLAAASVASASAFVPASRAPVASQLSAGFLDGLLTKPKPAEEKALLEKIPAKKVGKARAKPSKKEVKAVAAPAKAAKPSIFDKFSKKAAKKDAPEPAAKKGKKVVAKKAAPKKAVAKKAAPKKAVNPILAGQVGARKDIFAKKNVVNRLAGKGISLPADKREAAKVKKGAKDENKFALKFSTISNMDLWAPVKDSNNYGGRSKKNMKTGKITNDSYIPSGLTKAQYEKIRSDTDKKKAANYQRNVAKAGVFEDYTEFYVKRGSDEGGKWMNLPNLGHRMAKTKYDWSTSNDNPGNDADVTRGDAKGKKGKK